MSWEIAIDQIPEDVFGVNDSKYFIFELLLHLIHTSDRSATDQLIFDSRTDTNTEEFISLIPSFVVFTAVISMVILPSLIITKTQLIFDDLRLFSYRSDRKYYGNIKSTDGLSYD